MLTMLDLFSGIGGFSLAGEWAGFKTLAFCEKDKFCQKVLFKHWPNTTIYDDIKTLKFTDHVNLITAGFPCQPFSVAGKRNGINDDRYLWPEVMRVIRECRPTWAVFENVPGIIPMLDPILEDLEREKYSWRAYLIPACATGAPHKRERIWIVANCDSERCDYRTDNRKKRYIQSDWQRHVEKIQSEWSQFFPESWKTFKAQDWLGFIANANGQQRSQMAKNSNAITERSEWQNATTEDWNATIKPCGMFRTESIFGWEKGKPPIPGVDDGLPNGVDRNKSLGNSIVPQVAYPILALISEIERN